MVVKMHPHKLEQNIVHIKQSLDKAPDVVAAAYDDFTRKDHAHKVAYAKAYLEAEGSIEDRKQNALLECENLALEAAVAEGKYKHYRDKQNSLRDTLSALQSLARTMNTQFNSANWGS